MSAPEPLLLVGHGTVDDGGVREFHAFVDRVRAKMAPAGVAVAGGFIELAAPAVTEAWAELAGKGHRRIAAVPLVLVAAGHGKGDIPAALERAARRTPGTSYAFGRPLGPHPVLLDILDTRIAEVVSREQWSNTAVLLVGRGATDPDANAEVCKVSRLLQETRRFAFVETAFVSLAWPSVAEGLDRARRLGAHRIVVAPYFLFDGVLPQRVVDQSLAFGQETPDVEVLVAGYLGDTEELMDVVVERYNEALHGDIRMNCDTCAHRVLLPGFEDKLGAPQTPHHHPDDSPGGSHRHSQHGSSHDHGHGHGAHGHDGGHALGHAR